MVPGRKNDEDSLIAMLKAFLAGEYVYNTGAGEVRNRNEPPPPGPPPGEPNILQKTWGHMVDDMTPMTEEERAVQDELDKQALWEQSLTEGPRHFQPMPSADASTDMEARYPGASHPAQRQGADEMRVGGQPSRTPVIPGEQGSWEHFMAMNPGIADGSPSYDESFVGPPALSLRDRIAQQSGGNVPGGTFSEMPDTRPEAQSDKAFYAFVDKLKQQNRMDEMMDPRANTYDPEMARAMLTHEVGMGRNAADELYSRAQMLGAQGEAKEMAMTRKRMEMMNSPEGKLNSTVDFILQNVDPINEELFNAALRARIALNRGDTRTAEKILMEIQSNVGGAQASANETGQAVIG